MSELSQGVRIVSHSLCPFAQRWVLMLGRKGLERGEDFTVEYVDPAAPPPEIAALPSLVIDDETIIDDVEAASEFLDEVTPGSLHPREPAHRARDRQQIAGAQTLLHRLRDVYMARDEATLVTARTELFKALAGLERSLTDRDDSRFSMADAAYAPFFSLALAFPWLADAPQWDDVPRVRAWGDRLLRADGVLASRCPDHAAEFRRFFERFGSAFAAHV